MTLRVRIRRPPVVVSAIVTVARLPRTCTLAVMLSPGLTGIVWIVHGPAGTYSYQA